MRGRTAQAASPSPGPYAGRLKGEKRLRQSARFLERNVGDVHLAARSSGVERWVASAWLLSRRSTRGGAPDGLTGSRHDGEFSGPCIRASVRKHKRGQ